jgi:SOS-response transcriptional repressor LexA
MIHTMSKSADQFQRAERAERLKQARINSGFGGVKAVAKKFGWSVNTYKAHDSGQNGFSPADAKKYARAFGVSLQWLYFGTGAPEDIDVEPVSVTDVPLISAVSAGQLVSSDGVSDLSDFPTVPALDLPEGQWIALRVDGDSMNKISPPDSIVFANLRDRRLVHNACYIVTDEEGNTTYKRYRQNEEPPFQPASYHDVAPPKFKGTITVVGRVKRSIIEM